MPSRNTPPPEISPLSLHDALPILSQPCSALATSSNPLRDSSMLRLTFLALCVSDAEANNTAENRSEEHTSELQSRGHLVCRLLLEKKKKRKEPIEATVPRSSCRAE